MNGPVPAGGKKNVCLKRVSIILFLVTAAVFCGGSLSGEIVYLKDGQFLKGTIVREGRKGITLNVNGADTFLSHKSILRIFYGNQEMEQVYVLQRNGTITKGFLVDQDERKIILREKKYSPKEIILKRENIREISREKIFPADLEIFITPSYYIPLDSGGADLKPSPSCMAGIGFNSMMASNLRIMLESGYLYTESKSNDNQTFQVIPIIFSFEYRMGSEKFFFAPRAGAGLGIMEFDTGEGEVKKSNALNVVCGAGVFRKISDHIYIGIRGDYMVLHDGSDYLQNALVGITCMFRL